MSRIRFALQSFALLVFMLALTSIAQAQATRTWVSGVGDDVNPCSRTAPCKTFAGAISKTAAGGEINALDPGGYGTVTITKSMTIDGAGTHASVLACGTNGVIVNDSASGAPNTIIVTLRNLSINGCAQTTSPGINGIRFLSGKELHVQNLFITGFTTHGIDVITGGRGELFVDNTRIERLTGAASAAIRLTQTSGQLAVARINKLTADRVANGVLAQVGSRATVTNSHFSINSVAGVNADSGTGNTEVTVSDSSVSFSTAGVRAGTVAGSVVRITRSLLVSNGTSLQNAGGTITNTGSNDIF